MDTKGKFYLGRIYDTEKGRTTDQPLLYDPDDLTTHAVVVGMTGSGKTGLCIDMLEEAALNNIPALMIDPKGDITNALLHFPDLSPQDFQPWVNRDQARRDGQTVEVAAAEMASRWQKGLAEWDIDQDRIRALKNAAHFAIYTPGSNAGIPVSILASLKAPPLSWEDNSELLREKISGTVTALLGLVGMEDIDPVRSREHILLANIFEHAWSKGKDLDLGELILQTQNPPFPKLGVFDVDTFFPKKERFDLAMNLNNILAAPAFQTWIEGQPLEIPELLYGPDGRPRHSAFYIAHLSDAERMFFVTLLFSAVEAWMRTQSGTPSLRALLYFDEIFGYLPPIANPPSKPPMLRLLKQARAFGVGLVLATQNPADVDYKALSNTGTWFIGKLQTETDKERLLDGLQGAMAGDLDRRAYDRLISALGKRVFLLHNVHRPPGSDSQVFYTRWAMNFLAGPLTRTQIPALNELAGAGIPQAAPAPPTAAPDMDQFQPIPISEGTTPLKEPSMPGSSTRPSVPTGVAEYFLPNNLTMTQAIKASGQSYPDEARILGLLYRPVVIAQAHIRFLNRKYNLDYEIHQTTLVEEPDRRGHVRWDDFPISPLETRSLDDQPDPRARFAALEAPFSDGTIMRNLKKDFQDWAYRASEVSVRANEALKVYAGPGVSSAEFRRMCSDAAREQRDAELDKIGDRFENKIDSLEAKIAREARELEEDRDELSHRKMEEMGTHAETVLSLFSKRRRSISSSLSKRRMTQKAKADVEESLDAIEDLEEQMAELEAEMTEALKEVEERWGETANQVSEIPIRPYKKDVNIDLFGVAWMPYHLIQMGEETIELSGFEAK